MRVACPPAAVLALLLSLPLPGQAEETALAGPLSGRPAALGGAYGALADDAYAPLWNPAGLGFVSRTQLAVSHLSGSGADGQSGSLAHPAAGGALGAALQFSRPSQASRLAAFSLAYGRTLSGRFSLGGAVKLVEDRSAVTAQDAAAGDLGALYRFAGGLSGYAGVDDLGRRERTAPRLGAAYAPGETAVFSMEWLSRGGQAGLRTGVEWRLHRFFALRAGLDTLKHPAGSNRLGLTAGAGLDFLGQRFDYAYVAESRLGRVQSFSVVLRLGRDRAAPGQEYGEQAPRLYHAVPAP